MARAFMHWLRPQCTVEDQEDAPFRAPVIGERVGGVRHHSHATTAELPRAPVRHAALADVLRACDC